MTEQEVYEISKRAAEATLRQFQPTIDKLRAENKVLIEKYQDLIMQVQNKYPDETRHETAKRIIHQHETYTSKAPEAALTKEEL